MEKKNRFSMLEVKGHDKKSPQNETGSNSAPEISKEEYKRPKDFKIVVPKDEFSKNLERHNLSEKVVTIEKKKIEIAYEVSQIKMRGYAKIAIGVVIVFASLKKFFFNHEVGRETYMNDKDDVTVITSTFSEMTTANYIIMALLILLFGFLYYSGKKKEKK
jgi:hypothetical protein